MSNRIASGDVYMTDTQRLAQQDQTFAEWRHNGSEYQFWENRNKQKQQLFSLYSQQETIVSSLNSIESSSSPSTINSSQLNYPYILRFITNGMSAHNFGHVNHDILWPFIASYNLYHLFSKRPNEPIYVIDIGIFLVKFLQLAYPNRQFIGFRSINEVPLHCEEIIISGLGAPKSFDINIIRYDEMTEARNHMLKISNNYIVMNQLQINLPKIIIEKGQQNDWQKFKERNEIVDINIPTNQTISENNNILKIIFIERNITQNFKERNDERYLLDYQQDHPALRYYYDSGYWSHTVLTSKRILGSQRRHIVDFETVLTTFTDSFMTIYSNYYQKYHAKKLLFQKFQNSQNSQKNEKNNNEKEERKSKFFHKTKIEVIRLNPELYHYCEQIKIISTGNVSYFLSFF